MNFGGLLKDVFVDPFHGQGTKGAVAIALGQPGYFYEKKKQDKVDAANAAVAAQKAAAIQAEHDAQDATNNSIVDAKKRRRATLFPGTPLGGGATALGQAGSYDPSAGVPAATALGAGGG